MNKQTKKNIQYVLDTGVLPAIIVDEIAAIQNLSLPYKKVEDSNDSQ